MILGTQKSRAPLAVVAAALALAIMVAARRVLLRGHSGQWRK